MFAIFIVLMCHMWCLARHGNWVCARGCNDREARGRMALGRFFSVPYSLSTTGKDFAERVWALKPQQGGCLPKLFCTGCSDYRALNSVLMMEYLWSDLSMLAKAAVLLPTVIVEKLAWMTGCRRAWLAAVTCFERQMNH